MMILVSVKKKPVTQIKQITITDLNVGDYAWVVNKFIVIAVVEIALSVL